MWNTAELKERGKAAFKNNYWLCVLVSFIFMVVVGTTTGAGPGRSIMSGGAQGAGNAISEDAILPFAIALTGIFMFASLITTLLDIFVFNPLVVGCQNFFLRNTEEKAELSSLSRAFNPGWMNNVATMFLNDLFLMLWTCLFIIPGIVKYYSYRLVPYIMAENPDMKGTEAITLSRKMMDGNKWKAFCFDLSFIGWILLSAITFGIVGIFYVAPYYNCSCAELYKAIKGNNTDNVTYAEYREI